MLVEFLELLKSPVTSMINKSEEKNVKKEAILGVILAVIVALVTIINTYMGIVKVVNKTYKSLKDYNDKLYSWQDEIDKDEFKELKKEAKEKALEDIEFGKMFFKTLVISVVTILVVAAILFIISRMIKSPKDYISMVAMTNRAFLIYVLGFVLNVILSKIYLPIGIIVLLVSIVYAIISLANAFRTSIEIEDVNKFAIYSTIVIGVVIAILVFVVSNYISSLLSLSALSSLL